MVYDSEITAAGPTSCIKQRPLRIGGEGVLLYKENHSLGEWFKKA